jgi:hypothetical protein
MNLNNSLKVEHRKEFIYFNLRIVKRKKLINETITTLNDSFENYFLNKIFN